GSGTISISPATAMGDSLIDIEFRYMRDSEFSVNSLKIIFNQEFEWSHNTSDISLTNFAANTVITSDTISFSSVVFSADTAIISFSNVLTPSFSGDYKFAVFSGSDNSLGTVSPLQVIKINGAPQSIVDVKVNDVNGAALKMGEFVTVRGIITVASEFGSPSYIQDHTGGMSIYGPDLSNAVSVGDEIIVSGKVTQFSGLNQIEQPVLNSVISNGNVVEPIVATTAQLAADGAGGIEIYEGLLVRVNGVIVQESSGSSVANWEYKNYKLIGSSPADVIDVRIDNDTKIIGMAAPAGQFDMIGVLSQYKSSSPYIGGYQIMPRFPADIISSGPIIVKSPEEITLTENSITLEWTTKNPGTSRIRYGKTTAFEMGVAGSVNTLKTNHTITITDLQTATIYNLQAFSVGATDTSFSGNIVSSTISAYPTTGEINVYFNKSIDASASSGVVALSNVDLKARLLKRINDSRVSIDAALYSLSGNVGAEIASALVNAKRRGVKVRVIGEYDTRTTVPWTTLQNNGIPYINDAYGNNDGVGLHHNKFFVIDFRGGAPDSIWVTSGSWNPTDPGTNDDRQNFIEIQDVALAGAYNAEFNEMWGTSNDQSNPTNSRFGARKINNTPHNFIIGGKRVENYFSPSDRTTANIGKIIGRAEKSINIALLTFTRKELADSVISLKNRGGKARVILSNNTDTGTQFAYLQSNGIDILIKGGGAGFLHHKYAIIDAEPMGETQYVITGSHNWSSSAENSNDENTLIIQDAGIANLYLQEFTARYYEAGGSDSIIVTSVNGSGSLPTNYNLSQNYPNPFNPETVIKFQIPNRELVNLTVYDVLGREVTTLVNKEFAPGIYEVKFNGSELASGIYVYKLTAGSFTSVKKSLLIK
ncbi:MAG: phospholipase D-like domain-containing protein, partial [Bacteroidota bacterium]